MSIAGEMLRTYPVDLRGVDREALSACIERCLECAQACTACADACLAEEGVAELRTCVRSDLDCADVCHATAGLLSRHSGYDGYQTDVVRGVLEACATACASCGEECERHAKDHEHCAVCAGACRRCEEACRVLLAGALG